MGAFRFSHEPIDETAERARLTDPACGGYSSFEGWVRDHNEGHPVRHLEYEAFEPLALKEGARIIREAIERFGVEHAACVHRVGDLAIGEMAVWVGVAARHRHEAFVACRYIIDEVKHRVPIWKKEHYTNGDSGWVNCERCAATPGHVRHDEAAREHGSRDRAHPHPHHQAGTPDHPHHQAGTPDYSRQTALKEVGLAGQAKLRSSSVLVVGCGGLGAPVISYLAGAGIGKLGLVDADRLEASNLHRQTLYALADVGADKASLAAARVRALNPQVEVQPYTIRLEAQNAAALIEPYDLIVDCTDNFATKFLLNDVAVQAGKPVIFSSVYQYEGQLQVVRPGAPCLRCLWPEATRDGIVGNCAEAGVLGPVPGTFGSLQALEALKLLLNLPGRLDAELLVMDLLNLSVTRVRARQSPDCPQHARAQPAKDAVAGGASVPLEVGSALEVEFDSLEQAAEAGYELVDIREPHEVAATPAPGTPIKPIPMAQLLYGTPTYTPTGRSLLICASGRRSLAATQELRARGHANVFSLKGGVAALLAHLTA